MRIVLRLLPWLILIGGAFLWYSSRMSLLKVKDGQTQISQHSVLQRMQDMGKLELVKYQFKEITELKKLSKEYDFNFFTIKAGPDSKAVLISTGEAVGCIDLTRITSNDITTQGDSVVMRLPDPELCYFKINLNESELYDLQAGNLSEEEEKQFIDQLYQLAEEDIRKSALEANILGQARDNAYLVLKPLLEEMTGKSVIFTNAPEGTMLERR